MSEEQSYKNIFKTTFLFGFVQIFNIVIKIALNKIVAVLLGATGMGIIGLFNTSISFLQTGAGLGISQSAVRDISEANACGDAERFSYVISITKKIIWYTALFGFIITMFLSPYLSIWIFGDREYTISFFILSVVVLLNILYEGRLAILKGMQQFRNLAKANMIGSVVGLVSAVPFYYYWGEKGLIPSLIIVSLSNFIFSERYVQKVRYKRISLPLKNIVRGSSSMIKMGIALMLVSFATILFNLIVAAFIRANGSLSDVGFYNAGVTIVTSYFGIIISAMSTDFYPRIAAIYKDNERLAEEVNKQSETGLILIFPLVVLFVFLAPICVSILYSSDFVATVDYTDYAILGTILLVSSNFLGMILLVKQKANVFLWSVFGQRFFLIIVYIVSYKYWNIVGLGVAYIITGLSDILLMTIIMKKLYTINLEKRVYKILFVVLTCTIISIYVRSIENLYIRYCGGIVIWSYSIIYSYLFIKRKMSIDIVAIVKNRFGR